LDLSNSYVNQISAAPNPGGVGVVGLPWVTQTKMRSNVYFVDPNILIEAEQQFNVKVSFPSGNVPILATNVVDDTTNPVKIGVILDGLLLRPVQ
jgi:hypothetical protein